MVELEGKGISQTTDADAEENLAEKEPVALWTLTSFLSSIQLSTNTQHHINDGAQIRKTRFKLLLEIIFCSKHNVDIQDKVSVKREVNFAILRLRTCKSLRFS